MSFSFRRVCFSRFLGFILGKLYTFKQGNNNGRWAKSHVGLQCRKQNIKSDDGRVAAEAHRQHGKCSKFRLSRFRQKKYNHFDMYLLYLCVRIQSLFAVSQNGNRNRCQMWFPDYISVSVAESRCSNAQLELWLFIISIVSSAMKTETADTSMAERATVDRFRILILTFNLWPFCFCFFSLDCYRLPSEISIEWTVYSKVESTQK